MTNIVKTLSFALLVLAAMFVQAAKAVSDGDKLLEDFLYDVTFSTGAGSAEVDCETQRYSSGFYAEKYVYNYQIANINSDAGPKFSSPAIRDGANTFDAGYDSPIDVVTPETWPVVGSSPQSVDALFIYPILSNGHNTTSTALWFVSDYAPDLGNGKLSATTSAVPRLATRDVLTPVPEPAKIVLFGTCGLVTVGRRI